MTLAAAYDPDTPELRKARGAFFTPPAIASHVTDWAVRAGDDLEKVFDEVVALTAERNFDLYEPGDPGCIRRAR